MKSESKNCKHNIKLAFNNDEIISYCDKCGKILDRYVKVNGYINYYHTYPYYTYPSTTPTITCGRTTSETISVGDPYTPEMGSHTSTSNPSDVTNLK